MRVGKWPLAGETDGGLAKQVTRMLSHVGAKTVPAPSPSGPVRPQAPTLGWPGREKYHCVDEPTKRLQQRSGLGSATGLVRLTFFLVGAEGRTCVRRTRRHGLFGDVSEGGHWLCRRELALQRQNVGAARVPRCGQARPCQSFQ